jgi:dTMP kinase
MPFITFEGIEGSGKSTQLRMAATRLREAGVNVVETREPGGTCVGTTIREILLDHRTHGPLDPVAELLLFEADRRQHVVETLRPALDTGAFVLCDRYNDTTRAYQLAARGLPRETVEAVDRIATEGLTPDLTLLYDCPVPTALARARERDSGRTARFEQEDRSFHERARTAFLQLAAREGERIAVLDATRAAESLFQDTWAQITRRFPG